jgi:hypothetical protein
VTEESIKGPGTSLLVAAHQHSKLHEQGFAVCPRYDETLALGFGRQVNKRPVSFDAEHVEQNQSDYSFTSEADAMSYANGIETQTDPGVESFMPQLSPRRSEKDYGTHSSKYSRHQYLLSYTDGNRKPIYASHRTQTPGSANSRNKRCPGFE